MVMQRPSKYSNIMQYMFPISKSMSLLANENGVSYYKTSTNIITSQQRPNTHTHRHKNGYRDLQGMSYMLDMEYKEVDLVCVVVKRSETSDKLPFL